MFKAALKRVLNSVGYDIVRKAKPATEFSMRAALERCKERNHIVNSVIDIGASDGRWSAKCIRVFPEARYLCIEAQDVHRPGLETFCRNNENAQYIIAAAGASAGKACFDATDRFGGVVLEAERQGAHTISVPMVTVDSEVEARKLMAPYLLKLDTHGYEVPILEGARNTLKASEIVIIEAYNFRIEEKSLRYWELCEYMAEKGFASVDIADLGLRRFDNSFWQMDLVFIPASSAEFSVNGYA